MQGNNDAVERLLVHDDIATSLVVDTRMGFKRRKLSNLDLPPISEKMRIVNILKSIRTTQDIAGVLAKLRALEWTREVTANMDEKESSELDEHLKKYLVGLTEDGGFHVALETRYSMEGHQGAKVVTTKAWSKGAQICNLVGSSRQINGEFEQELVDQKVDTSCIIKSSKSKSVLVVIGPISFINHDHAPNCQLVSLPNKLVGIEAIKNIKSGDELTISYGAGYFGRDNKKCECLTCEAEKMGAFGKLRPGETWNRDLFTFQEDRAILKVFSPLSLKCCHKQYFFSTFRNMAAFPDERVTLFGRRWR